MPPKQSTSARASAAGSSKSKSTAGTSKASKNVRAPGAAPKKPTSKAPVNLDLSDLDDDDDDDPFAEDVEEIRRPQPKQKQPQQKPTTKRRRQEQMDLDDDNDDDDDDNLDAGGENQVEDEDEAPKTIPPDLLTRLLHEFFEKEGTRISRDANAAVAKYMDVFVRETIARTAVEKESGFLEVEDLEKVAPQLLLDL
ncbi:hypothetical protein SLS62_001638 [Diatrype stigma]|uniref:Centromere protein X n=1 Tax=Diatrype stigma TaxID=117547 RepID=A0AAN9V0P2_9PEZI